MSKPSNRKQSTSSKQKDIKTAEAVTPSVSGADRSAFKSKTPEEKKQTHIEGIIKTAVASIIGMIAGLIVFMQLGVGDAPEVKWYAIITIVAAISYYAMRLIFPLVKINTKDFGPKDWFYVEFIVIDFCLVTWTLLLN
ncbi:hypothetical protein V7O66_10245 [Methanolobus sp. ZRKC3]|uniref:EMC6-like membrane protein n=1 Tax=Methanolobus sp. ZRKC3 TaxID=3125786 RepID=UPI0032521C6D